MTEPNEDRIDRILAAWKRELPGLDLDHMGPMMRMAHVLQHVVMPVGEAAMAEHGLQQPEYDVLTTLRRSGEPYSLTPSELSDELLMSRAGMTKRLDRLETTGLVARTQTPGDRRSFRITLTPTGKATVDAAAAAVADRMVDLATRMSIKDFNNLDRALRALMNTDT